MAGFICLTVLGMLLLSSCVSPEQLGAGSFDTVIIDAGHGGHDRGARPLSGAHEKSVALDTSQRVAKILRSKGFRVIETRKGDYFVPLGQRVEIANRTPNSIFVSIHYNWAKRRGANGIEMYYYTPRSQRLASNILKTTLKAYPATNRGVKRNNYYVLRNNRRPAVLCELGFLSNPHDNRYAQSWMYRQKLAEAIAAGIIAERRSAN